MAEPIRFPVLAAEAIQQFQEGISLVFSKWWALQMAVENGWGGPHSREKSLDFSSRVFEFFHQPDRKEPIYIDDLENLLVEGMDAFHTDVYDGSIQEVAEHLMIMHEECLGGDYQSIQKLKQVKPLSGTLVRKDPNDSDDDDDDEEDEDEDDDEEDEDEDDESIGNDKASNMMVDLPGSLPNTNASQTSKNSVHQQMTEAEDGWTVVPSRKSKGRRN